MAIDTDTRASTENYISGEHEKYFDFNNLEEKIQTKNIKLLGIIDIDKNSTKIRKSKNLQ